MGSSPSPRSEFRLALSIFGVFLILGVVVEIISLLWEKPLAFLMFVGVGGALTFVGIVLSQNRRRKSLGSTSLI
jgi:hypothetical protein